MDCSTPGFPVHHQLPKLAQTHVHRISDAIHLILCHSFLLLPSIFPCFRVFSNQLTLPIMWPKYWSFSFNISPSSEHSGLISFRIYWLDLLADQGTLKSLIQQHSSKASIPTDYTLHGILQARILEWVAFPFSRGSSQPRD